MVWLVLAGCSSSGDQASDADRSDRAADDDPTGDSDTDVTTPHDTGTVSGCGIDPTLTVVSRTAAQPWHENEAEVTVTLSGEATIAARCVLASDPSEVHLVESTVPAASHLLRFAGLLANEVYTCLTAPTCPEMAGPPAAFTITTPPPPAFWPEVTATTYLGPLTGYALVNHSPDCDWAGQRLLVMDRDGRVRWYYETPAFVGPSVEFRYHGDDLFVWGGGWEPNALGRPRRVDLYAGEIYDSGAAIPNVEGSLFHHDGKQLPDGRILTLEQTRVNAPGGGFDGFSVRRIDPVTNTVDFEYDSQRAYNEGHLPGGSGDAWHANWVDVVDEGSREVLYVSLCNLGWTVAIDTATGAWLWTFGAGGDYSLVDEAGGPLSDTEFPQCEHGIERSGTNLLVYDNGAFGRNATRAAEYALDEVAMKATLLWTWTEPDWFETTLGDVDYLDDGHVWIAAGHADCFSSNMGDRTTVLEVDPVTGQKVWELRFDALHAMAYRADFADGCGLFANASQCPALAERLAVLDPVFTR